MTRSRSGVGVLLLLGALVALPSLPMRDLWNPDEPRYAEVAREMRVLDEWLVPHLNGETYTEKPPLFFWCSAALQGLGAGPSAGRLVTGLAAIGAILLTWSLGRLWLAPRAALLGAAVLATTELFAWIGRFGVLDVPLTFCTTLGAYGWYRARLRGDRTMVLFYLGMGLAVLVKGPVGIVLCALAALASWGTPRAPAAGRPWHFAWGPLLTLGIVAAWLVPACLRGGEAYTDAILFKQNVQRVTSAWTHERPFWYYLPHLAGGFFPWILLAPLAAAAAWRRRRTEPHTRAMLLWFAAGFLFFSAISGKRERYLLPLFPALALVTGAYLDAVAGAPDPWLRRLGAAAHLCLGGLGAGLAIFAVAGSPILDRFAERRPEVVEALRPLLGPGGRAALAAAGVALVALSRLGRRALRTHAFPRSAGILAAQMAAFLLAFDLLFMPRINVFKSPREVAELLTDWVPPGEGEVATFPANFAGAYNLYSGRVSIPVLEEPDAVPAFLLGGPGRRLVLTTEEHRAELPDPLPPGIVATRIERVGHREILFLTNFAP